MSECMGSAGEDAAGLAGGLTDAQAAERLRAEGYNELPSAGPRSLFRIVWEGVREPMFLLLVACAVLYLFLGDLAEALMLVVAVFVIMAITFFQERRTERALDALRDLSSPRALVIRENREIRIPGREVVRGDLVALSEGDRVPMDGVLLSCLNLSVDESLLTGESVPVRKALAKHTGANTARPGGDDLPFVYSGTLVVQGRGIARALATGTHTEVGRIGRSLQAVGQDLTPLQVATKRMVRTFGAIGFTLCAAVAAIYGLTRGDWTGGLLAGITMAISMIPEEFPVVLTIFLALGAWRIAQSSVLTRRMPAIETLGAATVLCVDKTGTLTQNRMTVCALSMDGEVVELSDLSDRNGCPPSTLTERWQDLVRFSILASQPDPVDPMERAIHQIGPLSLSEPAPTQSDWLLVRQYALSPELLAMTHAWKPAGHEVHIVAAKGAPEAIAGLCRFGPEQWEAVKLETEALADRGLRVLAVARSQHDGDELPAAQHGFDFTFLGLVGLADPVRPDVPAAVEECYAAGVRIIMVTGDYPSTASSIAQQIGLRSPEKVIIGQDLAGMSEQDLRATIVSVNVFARVMPEQKLLLVKALKAAGEVVAMTGDGVNDAPALKASHIGVAMGRRGTDVAREAADLVLLDDAFSSIVKAIRLGRRIYINIKDAMAYLVAVHVIIAGLSLAPVLMGWPLILLPVHVVFLEMIVDPACSIVFESEPDEPGTMRRPPRDPNEPVFTRRTLALSFMQGLSVLGIVLSVYGFSRAIGQSENETRAITYTTLVVANLALILTNLSWSQTILQTLRRPNRALWWIIGGVTASIGTVLYVPWLRELFRFGRLHADDLLIAFSAGVVSVLWFELFKAVKGRRSEITDAKSCSPHPGPGASAGAARR